ncbi:hypothetical protein BDW69DRAFT_187287 [Aspergillus filifer]
MNWDFRSEHAETYWFLASDPMGIDYGGYLSTREGAAVQKATGYNLGAAYWRPRVNAHLFHEAKEITSKVDWGSLYYEFEEFEQGFNEQLEARRWVL